MTDVPETERTRTEGAPPNDSGLVSEYSGQFGVSDKRRQMLSQMEQAAGVQHEAADESVPSRLPKDTDTTAG